MAGPITLLQISWFLTHATDWLRWMLARQIKRLNWQKYLLWCQLNPADWSSIGLWGSNSCRTETAAMAGAVDCSTIFHFASQSHTLIVLISTLQHSLLQRDQRSLVWTLRSAFARPTRDTNYAINVSKCIIMANQMICLFNKKMRWCHFTMSKYFKEDDLSFQSRSEINIGLCCTKAWLANLWLRTALQLSIT